jgi:hypothetical protein
MSLMSHSTVPCGGLLCFPVFDIDSGSSITLKVFCPGECPTPPEVFLPLFGSGTLVVSYFWESFCSSCLSASLNELGLGDLLSSVIVPGCCPGTTVSNLISARVLLRD